MNKQEIYDYLLQKGIKYELDEHKKVFNMDELNDIHLSYPEQDAKNLFVRDDKKRNYYLISCKGDKRIDLKEFRVKYNTRPLSFASSDDLFNILKLIPGSVTPLGLLNDEERKVEFFLDEEFMCEPKIIGCHPNENDATLWLNVDDLISLIKEHGNKVNIIKL